MINFFARLVGSIKNLVIIVLFILFYATSFQENTVNNSHNITSAEENTPYSSEIGIRTLSPEGESGGLAYHASAASCFPGDTEVSTPQGKRKIKDLVSGDEIFSLDANGEKIITRVKEVLRHDGVGYPTNNFDLNPLVEFIF